MTEFIEELQFELCNVFGHGNSDERNDRDGNIVTGMENISRVDIVDLDSTTSKKFSRHLIVHLPGGALFRDAMSCGIFVKRFVGRLAEDIATGVLEGKRRKRVLAQHLFVNTKENEDTTVVQSNKTCFIDLGVYTRNRLFRLMGSSKYGKSSTDALRIADANRFKFPGCFNNDKFYAPEIDKKLKHVPQQRPLGRDEVS